MDLQTLRQKSGAGTAFMEAIPGTLGYCMRILNEGMIVVRLSGDNVGNHEIDHVVPARFIDDIDRWVDRERSIAFSKTRSRGDL